MSKDKIPHAVIEQIKEGIDLIRIVGSYTQIRHSKALCPFHTEKNPSFVVYPKNKRWHCFGCGSSGDVISFIQRINKLSFSDAVSLLANQAGISLPKSARFQSFVNRRFDRIKQQLPKLAFCREVIKDYEKLRYAVLRAEWRGLLLKEDKNAQECARIDYIEYCLFDELNAFIHKVEKILDGLEQEVRNGKFL